MSRKRALSLCLLIALVVVALLLGARLAPTVLAELPDAKPDVAGMTLPYTGRLTNQNGGAVFLTAGVVLASSTTPGAAGGYTLGPQFAASGGYQLGRPLWRANGYAMGSGYSLAAETISALTGSGCCCSYLPLTVQPSAVAFCWSCRSQSLD